MLNRKATETSNKLIQTTIHCYPHILNTDDDFVYIYSDRSTQTETTLKPEDLDQSLYPFLKYIPYQIITANSLKEVDLPRKALLQWKLPTTHESDSSESLRSLKQDLSVTTTTKSVLKQTSTDLSKVLFTQYHHAMAKTFVDQEVQTTILVQPHVLNTDEIANVFTDGSNQTSISCAPDDSISNILPLLKSKLRHSLDYVASESVTVIEGNTTDPNELDDDQKELQTDEDNEIYHESDLVEDTTEEEDNLEEDQAKDTNITLTAIKQTCQCGTKLLNNIAGKLQVQTSAIKLTPQVFPAGTKFEDKMMDVLHTTVTILQSQMAQIFESYTNDEDIECPCTGSQANPFESNREPKKKKTKEELLKDSRSCNCATQVSIPKSAVTVEKYSKSCQCNHGISSALTDEGEKETRHISTTKQVVDCASWQPKYIKEDIVEETTRIVTTSANKETIIEERIRTTTVRENLPQLHKKTALDGSTMMSICNKPANQLETETELQNDVPPTDPAMEEETEESSSPENGQEEKEENQLTTSTEGETLVTAGDNQEIKKVSNIPCECQPGEGGAAPPTVMSPRRSDLSFIPCSCGQNSKLLLKKNMEGVKSISCPDTSKNKHENVQTGPSLPDLREPVIRLSVVYKTGPTTVQKQHFEELLVPGREMKIAPNSLQPSNFPPIASLPMEAASTINKRYFSDVRVCECGRLVCAKRRSLVRPASTTPFANNKFSSALYNAADNFADTCCCADKQSPQDYSRSRTIECPVHSVIPSAQRPFVPSYIPPPPYRPFNQRRDMADEPNLEITISYDIEDEKLHSHSFMYEHDVDYDEPYMEAIKCDAEDYSAAVQTDLALGAKLQSESLNSITRANDQNKVLLPCDSKTEIPWLEISLSPPGSYTIKSKKETVPIDDELKTVEEDHVEGDQETVEGGAAEAGGEGEEGGEEGGEEEGEEQEKEPLPPPPSPLEGSRRTRKEPLLCETDLFKENEPYMECLYRAFPHSDDDDEGECGSETEIPWKDILLPENCRIRKVRKKKKKCICAPAGAGGGQSGKGATEKQTGMFLGSSTPPQKDLKEDEVLEIFVGVPEYPSTVTPFPSGIIIRQSPATSSISIVSNINQMPRRTTKECILPLVESNFVVSIRAGERAPATQSCSSASLPFAVSIKPEDQPSGIVNIKPSAECPYPSERMDPFKSTNSELVSVVNPPTYFGSIPTETQSCAIMSPSKDEASVAVKETSSMPSVSSKKSINVKAKVSLKRMGQPDKTLSETVILGPEEERLVTLPDETINIKFKLATPKVNAPPETATPLPVGGTIVPPPLTDTNVFFPARCTCKDKVKLDTFKQDPVMAALEAYEAEMRPLREALTQLQQKIRNLNMPEMKGCLCTTALGAQPQDMFNVPNQPQGMFQAVTVRSKAKLMGEPGVPTRTTTRIRAQPRSGSPPGTCPYFQEAGFRPPPSPSNMYRRLPLPILPQRHQPYMSPSPHYMPPGPQGGYYQRDTSPISRDSCNFQGCLRKYNQGHRSNREYDRVPRKDIAYQAKNYGMYPDYRGRRYPDEQMAYRDSYCDEPRREKCKVRQVVSTGYSSSEYDSQGISDSEDVCSQKKNKRGCHQKVKLKRSGGNQKPSSQKYSSKDSCKPCVDKYDLQQPLRPGQALKTGPEEFLPRCSSMRKGQGSSGIAKVSSKTKVHLKFSR